ncbi:glycosyltransferase family 92 protein RCOM_0530710-like [Silene latifolia]|uniref:glycosyltransferase family 92 protein RCOM_0530710-like n=1 Tax=Silene latifolia TaxID=37657 RepID=UPI003D7856A0
MEIPDFSLSIASKSVNTKPNSEYHRIKDITIENTVLFPDFVLVILTNNAKVTPLYDVVNYRIDCVYSTESVEENSSIAYPMLSIDEHNSGESRWLVRCPLPPGISTTAIGLQLHHDTVGHVASENGTIMSWGNNKLVYEAAFDGEDVAAIFVKGLGLNGEKKSDPNQFKCRFGNDIALITKAITAAQEVIRCPLPQGVSRSSILKNNEAVHVTIERRIDSKEYIVPSIAKLQKSDDSNGYVQGDDNKYELCACTMVWNQAAFIREWIVYHGWLGIQRWFVYDNNSNDGLDEEINDLNLENYNVSRHTWPWLKSQEAGFAHCLLRARDQCNWVAFFDVDEFFYFPPPKVRNNDKVDRRGRDALLSIVQNMSSTPLKGQIKTNCHNFGPSGLKASPKEGVSLGYTCRVKISDRHKSIVRPDTVDESLLNRVHHFELKTGFSGKTLSSTEAVINHYKYPVWDVFKAKFERRVSAYVVDWKENKNEESKDRTPGLGTQAIEPQDWHLKFCEVWDTRLRDFIRANLADPITTLLPWQRSGQ